MTQEECNAELLRMADMTYRNVSELRHPEFRDHDHFECWPDTVDPRGPKAK